MFFLIAVPRRQRDGGTRGKHGQDCLAFLSIQSIPSEIRIHNRAFLNRQSLLARLSLYCSH